MLKDISQSKTPIRIRNSVGFFLAIYRITTPEAVINPIIIIVLRYGAGFVKAWVGGVVGAGSSTGVIIGFG